jgi:glutamine cyclotransferase
LFFPTGLGLYVVLFSNLNAPVHFIFPFSLFQLTTAELQQHAYEGNGWCLAFIFRKRSWQHDTTSVAAAKRPQAR